MSKLTNVSLNIEETTTPSTPDANKHELYFKSDNNLYMLDDAGNEVQVNAGSVSFGQYKTVAISGGAYTSIKTAVDSITDASITKPYTVAVYAGVYNEDPITLPSYVKLIGNNVIINAINVNSPIITMEANSKVNCIQFSGATNDACILYNDNTGVAYCENLVFKNSKYGVQASGAGVRLIVEECKAEGTIIDSAMSTVTGGEISSSNILSFADKLASLNSGEIWLQNCGQEGGTIAIDVDNSGVCRFMGLTVKDTTNVLKTGTTGTNEIEGGLLIVRGSTTYDILQQSSSGKIRVNSSIINTGKLSIMDWSNIDIDFKDNSGNQNQYTFAQDVNIGTAEKGREFVAGEGDSYTRCQLVYTENTSNVFVDVSDEAASSSGSTFTFPGVLADNCIYWGSDLQNSTDYLKFYGLKINTTTACVVGSGEIVFEYWNGSAWTEIYHMSSESEGDYLPYAQQVFERVGSEQIRFEHEFIHLWTKNDPVSSGTNRYWIRARIKTAVTTVPIFERSKLHTNRFEINDDGFIEYFGSARPLGVFPWSIDDAKAWNSSPSDQDLYALNSATHSDYDLGVGRIENRFNNGAVDKIGIGIPLPQDMDTSCRIRIEIYYMVTSATAGDIAWRLSAGVLKDGDILADSLEDAATSITDEFSQSSVLSIGSSENEIMKTFTTELYVPSAIPQKSDGTSDIVLISIVRDGADALDTYGGNACILNLRVTYVKWREGGHI